MGMEHLGPLGKGLSVQLRESSIATTAQALCESEARLQPFPQAKRAIQHSRHWRNPNYSLYFLQRTEEDRNFQMVSFPFLKSS